MPAIFGPPIGGHTASSSARRVHASKNKRKRTKEIEETSSEEEGEKADNSGQPTNSETGLEYTAVVTPLERVQRRLAGQVLDQPPPRFPFPHAPASATDEKRADLEQRPASTSAERPLDGPRSLHLQHLAALAAIVQRSLLKEDFSRASRALGLIFREDVVGRSAAIRNQGFMGIGAEVLLRQSRVQGEGSRRVAGAVAAPSEGLENAKRFYERLAIKHPYHKSWPGSVNAVDFYLALFNIWIYVVHADNTQPSHAASAIESSMWSPSSSPLLERTTVKSRSTARELEQANEIAIRMDTCMASLPYRDEPELIRLRRMVALWVADLQEDSIQNAAPHEQVRDSESEMFSPTGVFSQSADEEQNPSAEYAWHPSHST